MKISIWDGKYEISTDQYNFKVSEVKKKQPKDNETLEVTETDGELYLTTLGYPSTMRGCLKLIMDREAKNNRATTIEEYLKRLDKVEKQLNLILDQIAAALDIDERIDFALNKSIHKIPTSLNKLGEEEEVKEPKKRKRKESK